VIHQEPRTKTGGQKNHAKEGLLIFVTFGTKDIYIQLLHNAQNHAQTLHEAIHGDSQHPVCRSLVFGSQDSRLRIVDEGGILSAKHRGGGNGRKGSAHKRGKFLIDSQGLKRDRRQTCGREGQINGTGMLWSVSYVEKGMATNTHSEQGKSGSSRVVMMPAICGHLSHCEAKQPIRA
jgi:hypothetical protein